MIRLSFDLPGTIGSSLLPPLRKFAKDRGWKVIKEMIDHGYSGTTATRPQLTELMNLARRRGFDVLLVYALDRFGRSVKHLVNALDEFNELGIDFCAYNQNIDTTTAAGKLFFTMISGFAEFEAAIIKERVHAGLVRARAEGKTLGRPRSVQVDPRQVRALLKRPFHPSDCGAAGRFQKRHSSGAGPKIGLAKYISK